MAKRMDRVSQAYRCRKFFLYDNDSTDNFEEVLDPYIKQGIVSYIPWHTGIAPYIDPGSIPKHTGYPWTAFKDCVNKSKGKVKWLGILDTDEFINTKNDKSGLKKILNKYENTNVALVTFKWRCFGTGELWDIPKGALLTELIYKRAADDYRSHKLTKDFVRPEVSIFPRCHGSSLEKGYTSKNYDKIQINHYQYRGRKEAIKALLRNWLFDKFLIYKLEAYKLLEIWTLGSYRQPKGV